MNFQVPFVDENWHQERLPQNENQDGIKMDNIELLRCMNWLKLGEFLLDLYSLILKVSDCANNNPGLGGSLKLLL